MPRRNSIFIKIFIPIITIMIIQTMIVNGFLWFRGTVSHLYDTSLNILSKSAEIRSVGLRHVMDNYWLDLSYLEDKINQNELLPARDLDMFAESGFMLINSETGQIYMVVGEFMQHVFADVNQINITPSNIYGFFTSQETPDIIMAVSPVTQGLSLVAMGTESSLFRTGDYVNDAVFASTMIAILVGGLMLFIVVSHFSAPIGNIVKQLENPSVTSIHADTKTYEIDMLRDTLNVMMSKRKQAEAQIRKEQQRYLLALEISTDIFIEYNIETDILSVYFFEEKQRQSPQRKIIHHFKSNINSGWLIHPDDSEELFDSSKQIHEVRAKANFFQHIDPAKSIDGYFWFQIRLSLIQDDDGHFAKAIGVAREKTEEKLAELAALDISRRDLTTGFYNRGYGLGLIKEAMKQTNNSRDFILLSISINNFDQMEITYGRIFGAVFVSEFSRDIAAMAEPEDIMVRMGNDEFLIYFYNKDDTAEIKIVDAFNNVYRGEDAEFELNLELEEFYSTEPFLYRPTNPVVVSLDLDNKDNLDQIALELFERTLHIDSTITMLLNIVGRLFGLHRVIVCSYDANFSTDQVVYQWYAQTLKPTSTNIIKIPKSDFDYFESLLSENGTMVFTNRDDRLGTLIRTMQGSVSTYCCTLHENTTDTGRILFVSNHSRVWFEHDQSILNNVSKVISTYINTSRAHSASNAKSMFLSRVSHEIRTPMNAIIGLTNIALSSPDDPDRVHNSLVKIDTSANYLLELINDVLEMSRVESGRILKINKHTFSLKGFIRSAEDLMRFSIEEKGVFFNVTTEVRHSNVISDQHRLKQVIVNLLGNAYKFTEPGGTITLSVTEKQDGEFLFSVKDNGIGIPTEMQSDVFKPFEQVDSATTSGSMKGTGLGLPISQNIIGALGSEIKLDSEPGMGSNFYFILNLELDHREEEEETELKDEINYVEMFKNKRLLVVDDVDINIEVATFILEEFGFKTDSASNGQEGIDKFFNSPPGYYSAILMDVQMPIMDGIAATRKIRSNDREDAKTIPIIAVTANAFDEDLKKSIESGMNGHVSKPIKIDELLVLLKQFAS